MRLINIQLIIILLLYSISDGNSVILNLKLNKNKESTDINIFESPSPKGIINSDKKIIFNSWIKYFKLRKKDFENLFAKSSKDKLLLKNKITENFFVNPKFNVRLRNNYSESQNALKENKNNESFNDKNSFKLILFNDALNFISDEENSLRNTFETLALQDVKFFSEQNEDEFSNEFKRIEYFKGIYDLCVLLSTNSEEEYTICFPDEKEKENFKSFIKMLKKESTKSFDYNEFGVNGSKIKHTNENFRKEDSVSNLLLNKNTLNNPNKNLTDGYWITIQNWTQCNLACGGGKSFLQRLCVPPKGNGKPCAGEPILSKSCNTHKCPTVFNNNQNNVFTSSAIYRNAKSFVIPAAQAISLSFNKKPLRYDKCHLKEDNLFVSDFSDRKTIIPARVIMNEHSISVFKGDNYDSNVVSFNLKDTKIYKDEKDSKCFVLANNLNKFGFCAYISGSSSKNTVEEWIYDFNLFKFQCAYKKEIKQNKQYENIISSSKDISFNNIGTNNYRDFKSNDGKPSLFAQLASS